MFWGLIIEPNKRYTQTVEKSFHVSMASLDAATADNSIVQVMLCYDERTYLLCSLKKDLAWQVPLDLNFQEGTKIAFTSNGRGHVHLTGYLIPQEDDLDLDEAEDEEEEEEEEEEAPQLVSGQTKRKANESPKEDKTVKRSKTVVNNQESSEDDDDDDDDDDDVEEGEGWQESSVQAAGVEVDDSDEDDDDDDDEEEDDSEEEEEEETVVKPQQKKNKQKEQQQQQQQQQQKKGAAKREKQQMTNGKEAKPEQTKKQQQQQQNDAKQAQKKRIIEGGVQVEDVKVGNGAPAKSGKFVSVYYIGRLKNGKKFDSTLGGEGFKFRLGKGEVIKGWDVGIAGMKVGGKRKITIPPPFAYGAKGSPPTIPANSTLVFDVELKNVH